MSAAIEGVTMPKWGLAMSEGLVAAWHADAGATIAAGDELLDIETEKITNAYESPHAGVLRRQVVPAGEVAPVGALLAVVAPAEVDDGEIDAFVAEFQARFAEELADRAAAQDTGPEPVTIEAGGTRLRYLELGDGEGPAVVLIHGFGGDLNGWLFNQPVLAESARVIALDMPGHGGSGKDVAAPDVDGLAASVAAFLDALGLESAHLVGHSLGGAVAVALAAAGRARSLTLISPAGLGDEIAMDYIESFIAAKRRKQLKETLGALFADPELVTRDMIEEVLRFKRLDGVQAALETIASTVFAGGTQARSVRDELAGLDVPVQILWGREDRIVPVAHADGVPDAVQVHVLDDVGHMAHMERASEVNAAIQQQIERAG